MQAVKLFLKVICYILFLVGTAFGAEIQFTAQASKTKVSVGDNFQISYTINASASDFRAPNLSDFRVLSGPNQSTSVQIINGNYSQSLSVSFILSPVKEGKYKIKPASIKIGSKTLESNELNIEVVKGQAVPQNQQQAQNQNRQSNSNSRQDQSIQNSSDDIFLKVSLDKTKAYLGEPVNVTYKVYYRVNIQQYNVVKVPALNGFWSQDIEIGDENSYTENVNGTLYHVSEVKKSILFPQRTGSLNIDPLEMDFVIQRQSNRRGQSLFDQFFGTFENVKYSLKSQKVFVQVMPLPDQNKPASFRGAVGNFSVESSVDRATVKANEAINFKIKISGKGNLKLLETPKPLFPSDFESYDPKISEKITTGVSGVNGSITYEYLLIPRHAGKFTLEPYVFSFFDPSNKQYKELSSSSIALQVEKGEIDQTIIYGTNDREEVKILANDIQYIRTNLGELNSNGKFLIGSWLYYLLISIPVIGFLIFVFWWRNQQKLTENVSLLRSSKAKKTALKKLSKAKEYLTNNQDKLFYEELFKSLYGYVSDKLNIPVSELSKDSIKEQLSKRNIAQELVDDLCKTLDLCEMSRFAPSVITSKNQLYTDAQDIIIQIEQALESKEQKVVL
jgi:hypothetical protein